MSSRPQGPNNPSNDREVALLESNFGFKILIEGLESKINECLQTAMADAAGGKDATPALLTAYGMRRAIEHMRGSITDADQRFQKERLSYGG